MVVIPLRLFAATVCGVLYSLVPYLPALVLNVEEANELEARSRDAGRRAGQGWQTKRDCRTQGFALLLADVGSLKEQFGCRSYLLIDLRGTRCMFFSARRTNGSLPPCHQLANGERNNFY